jgi:unsaturated rhamnogalacturonyl hydrolase
MKLTFLYSLLTFLIFTGCNNRGNESSDGNTKWSEKLANTVIERNDSLTIYNNPSSVKWQYDIAMLGQAIHKLEEIDSQYVYYHKDFIDTFVDSGGNIKKYKLSDYNLDFINPAKGLLTFYDETGDKRYRLAIENIVSQLKNQPRTSNGGYWHKKIYPNQVWINSAYMVAPFMARYARDFEQAQWYDSACHQLTLIHELTNDPRDGLMVHAWDETKSQPWANHADGKSPNKWGRGMGWYVMALADVLEYLPEEHPQRKEIEKIFRNKAQALLKVRDKKTNLWYQVLDKGGQEYNYIETSCSAMFIYAFAKGTNMGVLPSKYKSVALESFLSLTNHFIKTDKDGLPTLTNVCGQAGLGGKHHRDGSFEYYINQEQIDNDPKGIAPLIMAAFELNI